MTDQTVVARPRRPPKGRSPSYPGVNLETALSRASEVYERERQHPAPVETVLAHWGYGVKSGGGRVTLAALKKFGLMEDEGSGDHRIVQLTDLGIDAMLNPDPAKKLAAIQKAALLPKAHQELWDEYRFDLPSEQTLRFKLTRERGFTDSGAAEFIEEYQDTIRFAKLDSSDTVSRDGDPAIPAEPDPVPRPAPSAVSQPPVVSPDTLTIPIPLAGSPQPVHITGAFPIPEQAWDHMIRVLEAMKPGLVSRPSDTPIGSDGDGEREA